MSTNDTDSIVEGGERKDEIVRAMYIMIVWIAVAILAGILLVVAAPIF